MRVKIFIANIAHAIHAFFCLCATVVYMLVVLCKFESLFAISAHFGLHGAFSFVVSIFGFGRFVTTISALDL